MTSMIESLLGMLSGKPLGKISQEVGISKEKTQEVLPDIMAVITGALAKNSSQEKGAKELSDALARDHDGTVLDHLAEYIGHYKEGEGHGILGHVLGNNRALIEKILIQKTGLDAAAISELLTMAAPMIMGLIGKTQKKEKLDPGSLKRLLDIEKKEAEKIAPDAMKTVDKRPESQPPQKQVPNPKTAQRKIETKDISQARIPQDVFDIARERLDSDPSGFQGADFRCQFQVTGDHGGQWFVLVNDREKTVKKGVMKDPVSMVEINDDDFMRLVHGRLNAPMALLSGKIKIKGDANHVIELAKTLMS